MADVQSKLLLVVDDDDEIREVAATALEIVDGFRVVTATGGRAAMQHAHEQRPDAILLDVMMPGISGLETVAELKSATDTSRIPVILLTARVSDDTPDPGIAGVIAKPFDPMQLGAEVRRLLGWES